MRGICRKILGRKPDAEPLEGEERLTFCGRDVDVGEHLDLPFRVVESAHIHLNERKPALFEPKGLLGPGKQEEGSLRLDGGVRRRKKRLGNGERDGARSLRRGKKIKLRATGVCTERIGDYSDPRGTKRSSPAMHNLPMDEPVVDPREQKRHARVR